MKRLAEREIGRLSPTDRRRKDEKGLGTSTFFAKLSQVLNWHQPIRFRTYTAILMTLARCIVGELLRALASLIRASLASEDKLAETKDLLICTRLLAGYLGNVVLRTTRNYCKI